MEELLLAMKNYNKRHNLSYVGICFLMYSDGSNCLQYDDKDIGFLSFNNIDETITWLNSN